MSSYIVRKNFKCKGRNVRLGRYWRAGNTCRESGRTDKTRQIERKAGRDFGRIIM